MSTIYIDDRSNVTVPEASLSLSSWWPEPAQLVTLARHMAPSPELVEHPDCLAVLGAPGLDMVTTSFSARACVLAASTGRAFYAHELRGRVPMPEALEPEVGVWAQGGTVPVWSQGVLTEPKYFSFFQDAPLPAFNPNHRRKWRAHELLHGVMGFYWHPEMTRFDFYATARLNELVPVVHWYGLDEMFRSRCPRHHGARLLRTHCVACEEAVTPFWESDREGAAAQENALRFATLATAHLEQEWAASMQEFESGQRQVTHWHGLNSSSDAVGYLKGHWPRCTAWSFGAWMEQFMIPGVDYEQSLEAYANRVAGGLRSVIAGDVSVSLADHVRLRQRKQLQDIAYRMYVALEWLDEAHSSTGAIEDGCMDVIDQMAVTSEALLRGDDVGDDVTTLTTALFDVVQNWSGRWPDGVMDGFDALGYRWESRTSPWLDTHLQEGIASAFPMTVEHASWSPEITTQRSFVEDGQFDALGSLRDRFHHHVAESSAIPEAAAQWLAFDQWIGALPQVDEDAEIFAVIPPGPEALVPGSWRLNATFRRRSWPISFVRDALGLDVHASTDRVNVLAVLLKGTLRLAVIDDDIEAILTAVTQESPISEDVRARWEMVETLFFDGVLVWTGYLP